MKGTQKSTHYCIYHVNVLCLGSRVFMQMFTEHTLSVFSIDVKQQC